MKDGRERGRERGREEERERDTNWKTWLVRRRPLTRITPEHSDFQSFLSWPERTFKNVVFPAPELPMMAMNLARGMKPLVRWMRVRSLLGVGAADDDAAVESESLDISMLTTSSESAEED